MGITDLLPGHRVHGLGVILLNDGRALETGTKVGGRLPVGKLTGRIVLDGGWLYAEVEEEGEGEGRVDVWPASAIEVIQDVWATE